MTRTSRAALQATSAEQQGMMSPTYLCYFQTKSTAVTKRRQQECADVPISFLQRSGPAHRKLADSRRGRLPVGGWLGRCDLQLMVLRYGLRRIQLVVILPWLLRTRRHGASHSDSSSVPARRHPVLIRTTLAYCLQSSCRSSFVGVARSGTLHRTLPAALCLYTGINFS